MAWEPQRLAAAQAGLLAAAAREWKAKLEAMPPFRKPTNAATRQRIRATLRSALSAACTQQLITVNVAALADLDPAKRPKVLVWTPAREARWRQTGEVPSAVMVWTGPQTAAFLNRARGHEFFALFHLIAFTGLRRGEAVGLRWVDLDLSAKTMSVMQQITEVEGEIEASPPKSDAGERDVALEDSAVAALKARRRRQAAQPSGGWGGLGRHRAGVHRAGWHGVAAVLGE